MPKNSDLARTTLWLSESTTKRLLQYYPAKGALSQIVRTLIARHVETLDKRTAKILSEQELTDAKS